MNLDGWPWKIIRHLFYITPSLVHHLKPLGSNWSYCPETLNLGQNWRCFVPCDLEIWWMTLKNNRAPLLCYIKLCASFQSHRWIQTGVTVRKRSILVKNGDFLSRVTLKLDGWPWKTIGYLFYIASSFVHHFITIGEFKLNLQSRKAQFGSKSAIYCPVRPGNATSSFVCYFVAIGEFKLEFQSRNANLGQNKWLFEPCDLEILWMTLTNNRTPLLNNIKLYASFHHHMWIQTGGTVRKWLSWVMTSVTLTFDLWPWPFAWTSLSSLVITPDYFVVIRWEEHSKKVWQTDGRTDGQKEVFLELLGHS